MSLPLLELAEDDLAKILEASPEDPRGGTITERAERFHRRNPHVYRYAVKVARYLKARGLARCGIGAIWEMMRSKYLETTGDIYKLNNNHRAFYARLIMRTEADLAGFFSTRESPHDREYFNREGS